MFDLVDPTEINFLVAILTILLAGVVRGFSGFGAAMIIVPALSAAYAPVIAIPVMLLVDSFATFPLVVREWRRIAWREIMPLAGAAVLFVPVGVTILLWADPDVLRWVMAGLILTVVIVMATGWRYQGRPNLLTTLATGAAAGTMSGSVGIGGPPVVLFWLAGQDAVSRVRANILGVFFLLGFSTFATFFVSDLITLAAVGLALSLIPIYGAALWVGVRLFGRVSDRVFRAIALTLVALVALASALA